MIDKEAKGVVNNAGFFVGTFINGYIKLIYDVGLENIINIASVDPKDKMRTMRNIMRSQR